MKCNILTAENFNSFYESVMSTPSFDEVAFDLETNSVEEVKAKVWGVGLAFEEDEAFYLPLRDKQCNSILPEDMVVKLIDHVCKNSKLLAHNGIYDILVWWHNYKIDYSSRLYADTILMKHCLEEEPPFGLKEIAVKFLGPWADKAQGALYENIKKNGGSVTKDNLEMWKADTEVLGEYCCFDVMLTYKLYNLFSKRLKEETLEKFFYEEEVMPLYKEVTIPMKKRGITIDVDYFKHLQSEVIKDITKLEAKCIEELDGNIESYQMQLLNEKFPVKTGGAFAKAYAEVIELPLENINKKTLQNYKSKGNSLHDNCVQWLLKDTPNLEGPYVEVQLKLFFEKNPDQNYVFNLRSKHHLKYLFFEILKEKPLSFTDNDAPQVDDDFLESIKHRYSWVTSLQDFNKLEKIKGTYIDGILDRVYQEKIYTSMLQFGTTSGRYASRNPNLQNLPRPKEDDSGLSEIVLFYTNAIRAGFVSEESRVFVDSDYSALEPRCFAVASADQNLQAIFHSGEDMYSAIAKRVFKLEGVSTYKKDANFLGKLYPEKRQIIKALALAVTYGAEAPRIAGLLKEHMKDITIPEAQSLIDDYLDAYPGLKNYIKECHAETNRSGKVSTMLGRVRHLEGARDIFNTYGYSILDRRWASSRKLNEVRYIYKNKLNNSTNFKIQGLAAHIVNRAMIKINRQFKYNNIDGWVCLQVHDQIISNVPAADQDRAKAIVQDCMENILKLPVPLVAEPKIAYNLKDSH